MTRITTAINAGLVGACTTVELIVMYNLIFFFLVFSFLSLLVVLCRMVVCMVMVILFGQMVMPITVIG